MTVVLWIRFSGFVIDVSVPAFNDWHNEFTSFFNVSYQAGFQGV